MYPTPTMKKKYIKQYFIIYSTPTMKKKDIKQQSNKKNKVTNQKLFSKEKYQFQFGPHVSPDVSHKFKILLIKEAHDLI